MDRELIAYFDERFRKVNEQLEAMREDTAQQFAAVRREMALDGRITALEDWRGRQGRDPIEVIRERYGPKATP